jgi:hypothetical protein
LFKKFIFRRKNKFLVADDKIHELLRFTISTNVKKDVEQPYKITIIYVVIDLFFNAFYLSMSLLAYTIYAYLFIIYHVHVPNRKIQKSRRRGATFGCLTTGVVIVRRLLLLTNLN